MIIFALVAISLVSIFAYVSLTVAVIFATAGRSNAITRSATLTSHIGELEGKYLYLGNQVTADQAGMRGFVAPKKVSVVKPSKDTVAFSIDAQ